MPRPHSHATPTSLRQLLLDLVLLASMLYFARPSVQLCDAPAVRQSLLRSHTHPVHLGDALSVRRLVRDASTTNHRTPASKSEDGAASAYPTVYNESLRMRIILTRRATMLEDVKRNDGSAKMNARSRRVL